MEAKMKKILFGISLILLLSVAGLAQKNKDTKQVVDPNDKEANRKSEKVLLQSGTNLEAQLQSTLDVKNAKVGDEVVLKTTKAIKQNGETVVPKGTNLIGRITEVQQKSKQNKTSRIGMVFDRIQGKNLAAPISASIVGLTNSATNANAADIFSSSSSTSTSSSGGASSSGGGGLLGGVTNTVGGVVNTTTNTVGGVTNTAGQTVNGVTQPLGNTVNGIQISKSVSGSAQSSSTLSAQDKNVRVEKGTTFHLQLNKSVQN
jgi:hypothetical protein